MNNDHLETSKFPYLSISPMEEAAIKQRADRVGKQMGEAMSGILAEVMLAMLAGKPQMTLPRLDDTRVADKAAKTPTESDDILTTGKSTKTLKKPSGLLTASEVANILRISKALAYRLMQLGEIPTIHFGRTTRVRRQDLEEFIGKQFKIKKQECTLFLDCTNMQMFRTVRLDHTDIVFVGLLPLSLSRSGNSIIRRDIWKARQI